MRVSRLGHYSNGLFPALKLFSKKKKEKKESHSGKADRQKKPKGNGISPEGWRSHYAVVFWLGAAVGVRLSFAAFLFFFGDFFLKHFVTLRQIRPLDATPTVRTVCPIKLVGNTV